MNPRVFALDIETTAFGPIDTKNCPEEIVSIQVFDFFTKVNYIFSLEDFDIANHTKDNKYFFDNRVYDFEVKFYKLESEELLLKAYFTLVKALNPLIVAAHNGEGFDFAYLFKRAKLYNLDGFSPFGKSKLQEEETKDGKLKYNIRAPGVFYMDSIALYKKFGEDTRTSASYSLDALASKVLGENKVEHDCFSSFDGFRTGTSYIIPDKEPPKESIFEYKLYQAYKENNNEKFVKISKEYFIHYSIIDTYLLYQLIDKMKIIDIMVGIAATMGTQLDQTLGIISTWSIYMRNYGLSRNLVMPEKDMNEEYQEFKGAFVKDPVKGKCGWTYSVDVTSMYPSQIMAFNISTDTYVNFKDIPKEIRDKALELGLSEDEEYHLNKYKENPEPYLEYSKLLEKYNLCGTLIGTCFRKDEIGILPDLVEKVFKARKADKEKMLEYERLLEETKDPKYAELVKAYDNLQLTKKILIVGVYGANGNPNFILFNPKISASITANSRFYVNLFSRNVDEFMMDKYDEKTSLLRYNDTDSGYFEVPKKLINPELSKDKQTDLISDWVENEIQPIINNSSSELGVLFNALDSSRISAKREAISDSSVFIAKKRYIMRVIDSEFVRFNPPKMKTMGVDLVRSTTPIFSQKYLKESIEIILDYTENDLKEWIKKVRNEFQKQPLLEIGKVSSVSSIKYDLKKDKSIPINSRAFIVTNEYIKDNNLNSKYQLLELREKVKMLYLKTPNPMNSNIFAYNDEKFANTMREYIDWDLCFEKFFLSPLKLMVEVIGYRLEKNNEELTEW